MKAFKNSYPGPNTRICTLVPLKSVSLFSCNVLYQTSLSPLPTLLASVDQPDFDEGYYPQSPSL